MTEKIICDAEDLTAIADAVRASTGSTETYNVSELSEAAVNAIGSGGVEIDDTLTVAGAAADSKATGDAITALSEEIAGMQGGGGNADWNASEGEAGYVKNRTHWLERPYEPIVWDGNTEGRDSVDLSLMYGYPAGTAIAYKISDHVLTKDELVAANVDVPTYQYEQSGGFAEPADMVAGAMWYADYSIIDFEGGVLGRGVVACTTVAGDFTTSVGIVIPSAGTYCLQQTASAIQIVGDVYHAIDAKYLPDGYATKEIAKLPTGGGASIVDVTELPTEDIREDVFYLVRGATFYFGGEKAPFATCHWVNTLPATGEPATDANMSQIVMYYEADTDTVSGFVPAELAVAFGLEEGWHPAETLFQVANMPYGGIVEDLSEMEYSHALYLYVEYGVKYREDDVWRDVQGLGLRGTGENSEVFNTRKNKASGAYSHAEGLGTIASGWYSHAEGHLAKAVGHTSHAEGFGTDAIGGYSHAEGYNTTASGNNSHAEGIDTIASGGSSHAEGSGTIASSSDQHVQGRYNIEDTSGKYAHIVGNGEQYGTGRSNAHTLDWDGNAWFAGGIELTSPNGTRYRFTVSDDGTLTATAVTA